jgi:parvulin-like peptidyl-prolyl isomerase
MKNLILTLCILLVVAGCTHTDSQQQIIASFRGEPIYKPETAANVSQIILREIVETLLVDKILPIEAQMQGFYASQDEIDNYIEDIKHLYQYDQEVTEMINAILLTRNISIDEYWEMAKDLANEEIAVSKLLDTIVELDTFQQELLVKYADDIVIYDDRYRR